MQIEDFIGRIVVITLDDSSRHKGLLNLADPNPETGEVFVQLHNGGEVYYVSADEIEKVELAALN